jgi:hypothetical protein
VAAVDLGAADADRPGAVAPAVDPPDGTAVRAAVERLELGDEVEGFGAGEAAERRRRLQGGHELEHGRLRLRQPALDGGTEVLHVWRR